ncbi:T6SS immunity protein Tdi1 domain-containing protein, partial [Chryseobacterium sp.]|uniref:T6SS immunity protein Tdi1 domain-containing protein n=1 Tax=Chryseobacterium sp. TaxID=1871047 RepID=UPI00321AE9AC
SYLAVLDILYNQYEILVVEDFDFFWNVLLKDKGFLNKFFDYQIFNESIEKYSPLAEGECYGFVPLPALGGAKDVKYAEKVKLQEYLSICSQAFG